jgi:hypothetical protein
MQRSFYLVARRGKKKRRRGEGEKRRGGDKFFVDKLEPEIKRTRLSTSKNSPLLLFSFSPLLS